MTIDPGHTTPRPSKEQTPMTDNTTEPTPTDSDQPAFPLNAITDRAQRPDDIPDHWELGFKAVRPDLTTRDGFRWWPGTTVRSDHNLTDGDHVCPALPGDGLCTAVTMAGAASGGFPSLTLVALWFDPADVVAETDDKRRHKGEIRVGEPFDTAALLRGAYLDGANLGGADLGGAYLGGANLDGAYLRGANLGGADLGRAYLDGANLGRATYDRWTIWSPGFTPPETASLLQ